MLKPIVSWLIAWLTSIPGVADVPLAAPEPTPKPLLKYTFNQLEQYQPLIKPLNFAETMMADKDSTAYLATYSTGGKTMSLQVMIPLSATPSAGFPALLMIRGFVDAASYQTGIGTKNAAKYFAQHGFITVAPDFLGYGISDDPPVDTIEARLERPKQLLDLIASMKAYDLIDKTRIGIWGHSNGGQIALSLLEITKQNFPTVLWAPVSKPFPYSVLYYTDDSDDQGKELRRTLAVFEKDYDVFDYSLDKYWTNIQAPLEIHQGSADDAVPLFWSTTLVDTLKNLDKDITYFTYPGADHNLRPAWQSVVERSLQFFKKHV